MKTRLTIVVLFVLFAVGLGGYRYYLHRQIPTENPDFIKDVAPKLDPETGAVLGTPPA